ncbi:MAG TPA: putative zinc-binding protein [Burkholderiales bacterium]|nr:putative zinc-binding protein [Burkholderiales bacterium]
MSAKRQLPLVYSCSGCSSAAQMANHLALRLDRLGAAEMSCVAGVGGDVPHLLKIARSGRPIVALDGCPLECARNCLARHGLRPRVHHVLSRYGVRKHYHADFDAGEAEVLLQKIRPEVEALRRAAALPALLAGKDHGVSAAQS